MLKNTVRASLSIGASDEAKNPEDPVRVVKLSLNLKLEEHFRNLTKDTLKIKTYLETYLDRQKRQRECKLS